MLYREFLKIKLFPYRTWLGQSHAEIFQLIDGTPCRALGYFCFSKHLVILELRPKALMDMVASNQ